MNEARIVTRKEAIAKKLKFYFTGKPCRYGHVDKRNRSNGQCLACRREENARWRIILTARKSRRCQEIQQERRQKNDSAFA